MGNQNSYEEHNYQTIQDKPNICDLYERSGIIEYNTQYNKWLSIITFAGYHHYQLKFVIGYYDTREEAVKK
jgi:hypothetical protein